VERARPRKRKRTRNEEDEQNILRGEGAGGGVTRDKHLFTEDFAILRRDKGVTSRQTNRQTQSSARTAVKISASDPDPTPR
jgi:hypothetical protein